MKQYSDVEYGSAVKRSCQNYVKDNPGDTSVPWNHVFNGMRGVPGRFKVLPILKQFVRSHPEEYALVRKRVPGTCRKMCVVCFSCAPESAALAVAGDILPQQDQGAFGPYGCDLCKVRCNGTQDLAAHISSARHRALLLQRAFHEHGDIHRDKGGVSVSQMDGEISGLEPGITYELAVTVTNGGATELSFTCTLLPAVPAVRVLDGGPTSIRRVSSPRLHGMHNDRYDEVLHDRESPFCYLPCYEAAACWQVCPTNRSTDSVAMASSPTMQHWLRSARMSLSGTGAL
jgi:hypothetical protein